MGRHLIAKILLPPRWPGTLSSAPRSMSLVAASKGGLLWRSLLCSTLSSSIGRRLPRNTGPRSAWYRLYFHQWLTFHVVHHPTIAVQEDDWRAAAALHIVQAYAIGSHERATRGVIALGLGCATVVNYAGRTRPLTFRSAGCLPALLRRCREALQLFSVIATRPGGAGRKGSRPPRRTATAAETC